MTPQKQLVKHNPPESYGDCMRACYAILLDKKVEEVPHFLERGIITEGLNEKQIKSWLYKQGYYQATFLFACEVSQLLDNMEYYNPNVFYILGCASVTADHSVVCKGGNVVCDPGLGENKELQKDSLGYLWVTILIPINQVSL